MDNMHLDKDTTLAVKKNLSPSIPWFNILTN